MKKLIEFLRIREWFASKCGLLLGIVLFEYWKNDEMISESRYLNLFFVYALFITCFLAFGYIINDYCDKECDRLAGKKKIIAEIPSGVSVGILCGLIFVANVPLIWVAKNRFVVGLSSFLTFFSGMIYSARPFRLKERGAWGLLASSIAQRCMPLWVLYELISIGVRDFILLECMSLFLGIRYILVHQRIDVDNDVSAGIKTFGTMHYQWIEWGIYFSFTLEILFLNLLIDPLKDWKIGLFVLIYGFYLTFQIKVVKERLNEKAFLTFSCVPLEEFYNFFIPIGFATLLSMQNRYYFVVLIFLIVTLGEFVWEKWSFLLKYIVHCIKGGYYV